MEVLSLYMASIGFGILLGMMLRHFHDDDPEDDD